MVEVDSREYKWVNKDEFQHGRIQEEGEDLLKKQDQESEERAAAKLFHFVMQESQAALLHIDDGKKEMRLYNIPTFTTEFKFLDNHFKYGAAYSEIRNRFKYVSEVGYDFGQRGAFFDIFLFAERPKYKYALCFNTRLR
jgi:hypothetical protein